MEILDLRLLHSQDLEPLLEEAKVVWRESLRWDYSATAAMVQRFLDARALTGYAAIEDGRAVGYCFYVYENHKGLIGDVFVSNSFRNGTTEAQLLTHVLETLQATPGIRRIEAQLIHLDGPSVRQCFHSWGFQSYDRKFLFLSLADVAPLALSPGHDVELRPWDAHWFPDAAELITRAYQGHVDSAVSDQYRTPAGAARFLENIVHYPGCGVFHSEGSFLAFHPGTSSLCGMMLLSVVSDRVAHITQLCVAPEWQGLGIGRSLISQALQKLRERGFQAVTLTVTVANTRAIEVYERLGFSTLATFPAFAWDVAARRPRLTEKRTAIRL